MKTKLVFLFALSVACYAQTYALAPVAKFQGLDNNGVILSGGLLYSYAAGTSTPAVTFSDNVGTPNSNPVVLDASGRADVWLNTALSYKFILKTSSGVQLWSVDDIMAGAGGGGGGSGCTTGSLVAGYMLFADGSGGCTGTANAQLDASGNISVSGSGAVIATNGPTGAFSVTSNTANNSLQTVGGLTSNAGADATIGATLKQHSGSATGDFLDMDNSGGTRLAYFGSAGTLFGPGADFSSALTLAWITGSTQCLQVNTSGQIGGTGGTCGGGGGGSSVGPIQSIQYSSDGSGGFGGTSAATVTSNGAVALTLGTTSTVGLTVNAHSGQTADLVDLKSSGGTVLADFGSLGTLFGPGAVFTITNSATQGLFVKGAPGQTANLAEFQNSSSTVLAYVNNVGVGVFPSVTGTGFGNHLDDLTIDSLAGGGTQCLQVGNTGVVSATGSTCGGGGGGGSPGAPANSVQTNNGSGGFAGSSSFLFSGTTVSLNNTLAFITSAGTLDASASGGAFNFVGSTSTNGNFVFTPGNVAANSSVVFNAGRADEPALYAKSQSGTTTGTIFALRNNSNVAKVWVMQSGDATCPDCAVFSNKVSIGQATNPSAQLDEVISNAANIGYKLTGANGQSVDYLDVNSFGNTGGNLVAIGNLGTLFAKAGLAVTNGTATEAIIMGGSGQTANVLQVGVNSEKIFQVHAGGSTNILGIWYDGTGSAGAQCSGTLDSQAGVCWYMSGPTLNDGQLVGERTQYPFSFPNMAYTSGKTIVGYVPLLLVGGASYYVAVYQ